MRAVDRRITPVAIRVAAHGRHTELIGLVALSTGPMAGGYARSIGVAADDEIGMTIECSPPGSL